MLQLLTQVSGRAGREALPGEVLIQTRHPEHPLMQQLDQPYDKATLLLAQRQRGGLPPYGALGVIRCDSQDRQEGLDFLQQVKLVPVTQRDARLLAPYPLHWLAEKSLPMPVGRRRAGRAALAANIARWSQSQNRRDTVTD